MELIAQRQKEQFSNSVTPRLQSTDVNNILMSLLHSLLLSKHVACWQSFKLKPSWGLSVLRNDFEFSTLAFHSINVSSGHCFPMRSKVITWLVKDCCDTLISSFERDDLEQVNVLKANLSLKWFIVTYEMAYLHFRNGLSPYPGVVYLHIRTVYQQTKTGISAYK